MRRVRGWRRRRRLRRTRVAVIGPDVERNALGRAWLLAALLQDHCDVEVVGAGFSRDGPHLWPPVRDSDVRMRAFRGEKTLAHVGVMQGVADGLDVDLVIVSKPRLPSLGLGMMIKERTAVPVIVDVDDFESALFGESGPTDLSSLAARRDEEAYHRISAGPWTRACDPLVAQADAITVSSQPLRRRYGGTLVPHARDERLCDPSTVDREAARHQFGLASEDRAIVFAGTPRPHKGLSEVLEALQELRDGRYKFIVVGTPRGKYGRWLREQAENADGALRLWPDQPLECLPTTLAAADLVCLLQDPASEISHYQVPAKLTDALAMGVPILATDVPPLADLAARGAIDTVGSSPLAERIDTLLRDDDGRQALGARGRATYLAAFSYAAVRPVLLDVVEHTMKLAPRPLPKAWAEMLETARVAAADLA